jgi:hypothetical protein
MTVGINEGVEPNRAHGVRVTVNRQPVDLRGREVTGLVVKEAAIAQGVEIKLGFQLSVKHNDRYLVIGDTDTITVHEGEEFLAVAPDDNS